jgi:hypothetical protein
MDQARAALAQRMRERQRMRQAAIDVLLFGPPTRAPAAFRGTSGGTVDHGDRDVTGSIGVQPGARKQPRPPGAAAGSADLATIFASHPLGPPRPFFASRGPG